MYSRADGLTNRQAVAFWGLDSFTQKAGNLRRGKVDNCQAFVLEQPLLLLPNR
jgi:hypothetical protein